LESYWRILKDEVSELIRSTCWWANEKSKEQAEIDFAKYQNEFLETVRELLPEAYEFNPSSTQQLQQFLFAPFTRKVINKKDADDKNGKNQIKVAKKATENVFEGEEIADEELDESDENGIDDANNEDPMKIVRNFKQVDEFPEVRYFKVEKIPNFPYPEEETDPKFKKLKFRDMPVKGYGIPAIKYSLSGLPSVDTDVLKKLVDGVIQKHFESDY